MLWLIPILALGTSVVLDKKVLLGIRDQAFEELAKAQRGDPERAMLKLQHAQIAQEYGWVCEHVGDLTHRMSEHFSFFEGNHGNVYEKTKKTLRALKQAYGFERNLHEQIASNFSYYQEPGSRPWFSSEAEALQELKRLGELYAIEHEKLLVYNRPQWLAQEAAIAMGRMNFRLAILYLEGLMRLLDQDESVWIRESGRFDGKPYDRSGRG
jgi:hypothetical protein